MLLIILLNLTFALLLTGKKVWRKNNLYANVAIVSRKVKLTFILHFGSNRNAFYLYTVTSAACSSTPCDAHRGYIRGVATVSIYPYPALNDTKVGNSSETIRTLHHN